MSKFKRSKIIHVLSNIDASARRATCAVCGDNVEIRASGGRNGSGWKCNNKLKEHRADVRARRLAFQLCSLCGKNPPGIGTKLCDACNKQARDKDRHDKPLLKAAGKCLVCKRKDYITNLGNTKCIKCYLKATSVAHLGTSKPWKRFLQIFKDQKMRCPYTGRTMLLGVNTSLDHITPKCKGGTNDFSNLQWVYRDERIDINLTKTKCTHFEFVALIDEMYRNLHGLCG
jgi:hypothetical protein